MPIIKKFVKLRKYRGDNHTNVLTLIILSFFSPLYLQKNSVNFKTARKNI